MQYSLEESALISGLIAEYFSRESVSEPLRLAYQQVHQHLTDGYLTPDDLKRIQAALDFLSTGARGTENIPRSDFENKSHAEKRSIKKRSRQAVLVCFVPTMDLQ